MSLDMSFASKMGLTIMEKLDLLGALRDLTNNPGHRVCDLVDENQLRLLKELADKVEFK